jgi:hypothetical protein
MLVRHPHHGRAQQRRERQESGGWLERYAILRAVQDRAAVHEGGVCLRCRRDDVRENEYDTAWMTDEALSR